MRLHPFRALQPAPGRAADVSSPPYDVMSGEEARAMVAGRPDSFLRVVRSEVELPVDADPHSDDAYLKARTTLTDMVTRGVLVQSDVAALWLYRLEMEGRTQTGWVGCAEVEDYRAGRVRKHEYTRPDKEDDRTRHVDLVGAQTGPVFLTCHGTDALRAASARYTSGPAEADFVADDGVRHTIWRVSEPAALAAAAGAFAEVADFYIADGHHRAASAARVRDLRRERAPERGEGAPWERFLCVVFPAEQLTIMAYNRVVADLDGQTPEAFLAAVAERFEVGDAGADPTPREPRSVAMYLKGAWRTIRPRPGTFDPSDPVASLDVAILQDGLLGPVLGITDPRRDPRISFVGGIRGTQTLADRVDGQGAGVAFSMVPTSIDELLAVADADQVMPPKSTWFEPKLRSGLFVHPLGE